MVKLLYVDNLKYTVKEYTVKKAYLCILYSRSLCTVTHKDVEGPHWCRPPEQEEEDSCQSLGDPRWCNGTRRGIFAHSRELLQVEP